MTTKIYYNLDLCLQDMLLSDSDSSDDDDDDSPITEAHLKQMLKEHACIKKHQTAFPNEPMQFVSLYHTYMQCSIIPCLCNTKSTETQAYQCTTVFQFCLIFLLWGKWLWNHQSSSLSIVEVGC